MQPEKIIQKYYRQNGKAQHLLLQHSKAVAKKAVATARKVPELKPDIKFIEEAALLHDIGIFFTNAPDLGCYGRYPYVCHGYLGRELLEKEGFPRHALVCERHVGVGISAQDIEAQKLPLPKRDMLPITTEEEIICFADKFFSKTNPDPTLEKDPEAIKNNLVEFGADKPAVFNKWLIKFKHSE